MCSVFQLKNRFQFSFFSNRDIACLSLKKGVKNHSLAPIPIHSLKLIPNVRKKLNSLRKEKVVLEKKLGQKLAVFVPYRNRAAHLEKFIPQICQFLDKKKINYHVFIIEQKGEDFFNRGALLNLGVREFGAGFNYFCFHDVDIIPVIADYNYYTQPMRLISLSTENKEKIPKQFGKGIYNHHFAAAISIPKEIFLEVNGFCNLYYHYGLEDDDLFLRLLLKGYIPCVNLSGYYVALPHTASQKILPTGKISQSFLEKRKLKKQLQRNKKNFSLIKRGLKSPFLEGLNHLVYKIDSIKKEKNYTFCSAHLLGNAIP